MIGVNLDSIATSYECDCFCLFLTSKPTKNKGTTFQPQMEQKDDSLLHEGSEAYGRCSDVGRTIWQKSQSIYDVALSTEYRGKYDKPKLDLLSKNKTTAQKGYFGKLISGIAAIGKTKETAKKLYRKACDSTHNDRPVNHGVDKNKMIRASRTRPSRDLAFDPKSGLIGGRYLQSGAPLGMLTEPYHTIQGHRNVRLHGFAHIIHKNIVLTPPS